MRETNITTSLVDFLDILTCTIEKKINTHGTAIIAGHINSQEEENLLEKAKKEPCWATIRITSETGEEEELFTGIVQALEIESMGGLKKAIITLTGGTKLLDCRERTRTFQEAGMTYNALLTKAEQEDGAKHLLRTATGETTKDIIVQYKETNWTFIQRMASHHHSFVMPYYKENKVRYYMGLDTTARGKKIKVLTSSIVTNMEEYLNKKKNQVSEIRERDTISYVITSRDYAELGDKVELDGNTLYVYEAKTAWQGGELLHTYQLRTPGGFLQIKQYNTNLIGASLEGHIIGVKADQVKVCVSVDGSQEKGTAKWFSYSTVYSSPDGSGWYCMPEENDRVRLYFPTEKEEDGYIISSIHAGGGTGNSAGGGAGSAPRSNPDNKSIMNKYNKQLKLTPTSITMTNNQGMTIQLDDEEGIQIVSDKDVVIQAKETMSIISVSESMSVEAKESIEMIQGDTKITLKDDVIVEGAKVKVQ